MIRVRPGSAILFIRTERMVAARSKPGAKFFRQSPRCLVGQQQPGCGWRFFRKRACGTIGRGKQQVGAFRQPFRGGFGVGQASAETMPFDDVSPCAGRKQRGNRSLR